MAQYLVLARKYRSTTFDEVVGQEHVASTLKSAIATGRVAHAFLFTGTRGVGKTTMARILAKSLNCTSSDGPTATPCNKCNACIAIGRGDDVDVVEIDGASNRGIDEIRELRSNAIYRPSRCRYKIYYIDEVHMLTKEAFNALLKTLEEPPEHVKFIFATTETEKVPATIVSRCQRFDFRNIPTRKIADHLTSICKTEDVKITPEAMFRIARAGAGSMRDALSLLDQLLSAGAGEVTEADVIRVLGVPPDEQTASIVTAIAGGDTATALGALDGLITAGITLDSAINAVGEMFRHMMLAKACGPTSPLIELPENQKKQVGELSAKFSLPALVGAVNICQMTARSLRGLTLGRGLVEAALVRLAAADKFVDPTSLVERLENLAAGGVGGPSAGRGAAPAGVGTRYGAPSAARPPITPTPSHLAPRPTPASDEKKKILAPAGEPGATGTPSLPVPTVSPGATATPFVAVPIVPATSATGASSNTISTDEGTVGTGSNSEPVAPAPAVPFDLSFLKDQWPAVLSALTANKAGFIAGLLTPAKVMDLAGDRLKLGFDQPHEGIIPRCQKMAPQVAEALSRIFARPVRCEFAATGQAGEKSAQAAAPVAPVSSAERAEVLKDPAVKAVMEMFDGTLGNIIRTGLPTEEADQVAKE